MNEFQYVIDDNGNKTAVIIDLLQHKEIWEEFSHLLLQKRKIYQQPITSFINLFDKQDIEEMSKAIEEHCEKIDNEW